METTLVGAGSWLHQCVLRNTLAGSFRWFHVPEWPCSTERNVHIANKDSKGAQSSMLSSKLIPHGRPQGSLICAIDSEKELTVLKTLFQTLLWNEFKCKRGNLNVSSRSWSDDNLIATQYRDEGHGHEWLHVPQHFFVCVVDFRSYSWHHDKS